MEKEILFAQNGEILAVEVIETMDRCKVFLSEHGRPTLWYEANREKGGFYGTKEIAKRIPNDQKDTLCYAISLIKRHYNKETKKQAIEDFYPRIKSIVRRLYKGDYALFSWLKNHDESHMVTTHADLFRRAASEIKTEGKTLKTDKFDTKGAEKILAILS